MKTLMKLIWCRLFDSHDWRSYKQEHYLYFGMPATRDSLRCARCGKEETVRYATVEGHDFYPKENR